MSVIKIEYVFAFFALIAALDKMTGNHFKLGSEFEKGIMTLGPLVISMSGMMVLTPFISKGITFVLSDIIHACNMDMSVVATFFPSDSGAAVMAYELSDNIQMRGYNGIIVASMFGATICPVIPMALKMIDKTYHDDILTGFLCGLATIPVGCVVAGLIIKIPIISILINTAPSMILSVIICVGLIKKPQLIKKSLGIFGDILFSIMTLGLGIGIFHKLTGIAIISDIELLDDTFLIIANIAIILSGVFPLLSIISRLFKKYFVLIGNALKVDSTSVLGLITMLANVIPVFALIEKMNKKGRIINTAFAVSAGFVFGDHLAFVLSYDSAFTVPLVVGKLLSGVCAVILAEMIFLYQSRRTAGALEENDDK